MTDAPMSPKETLAATDALAEALQKRPHAAPVNWHHKQQAPFVLSCLRAMGWNVVRQPNPKNGKEGVGVNHD